MRRLLLTQSQVSVAVSSGVVIVFTFLLFLSGYVLQQRTVTGLQATIRPRHPKPPPSYVARARSDEVKLTPSRFFKGNGLVVRIKRAEEIAGQDVDWKRLGHVQLVRGHHDVCNAVMILAELHRLKSPARRILLFPRPWAEEKSATRGQIVDPFLDSSRRLMRLAVRRYGVELRPVEPIIQTMEDGSERELYSLASAYALTDLNRVLAIETPSLLLDAIPLDRILAYTDPAPFAMLNDTHDGDGVHQQDLMLFQPNRQAHGTLIARIAENTTFDGEIDLSSVFSDPMLLAPASEEVAVVRSIGQLHNVVTPFNATAYLDHLSYIRFSDPKLPGPQYDLPYVQKLAARPKDKDADWTWTKLYGEFGQKRMEICGLDLEPWHGNR